MTKTAVPVDPFAPTTRGIDEPDPIRPMLRAAGPVVEVVAPAGGSAWIVTDDALARAVLVDPRITKDPAWAPAGWDPRVDLEKGREVLEAVLFELVAGAYREAARSVDGVLRATKPWPFEADLRALATGRR